MPYQNQGLCRGFDIITVGGRLIEQNFILCFPAKFKRKRTSLFSDDHYMNGINLYIILLLYMDTLISIPLLYLAICSSAWYCPLIFFMSSVNWWESEAWRCLKAWRRSSLCWLSSTCAQEWLIDRSVE